MNIDLKGKKALVCGGSQGIGLATAQELALLGAQVTLISRSGEKLKKALNTLGGTQHDFIECDLTQELPSVVKEKIQKRGPFDILINNAGGPPSGPLLDAKEEDFLAAFSAHLLASHRLAKLLVPGMKEKKAGRIINIVSTSVKAPLAGLGLSNTIRGSVGHWVKSLSQELGAYGITVNAVLPGATLTERLEGIVQAKAQRAGISVEKEKEEMLTQIPLKRFAQASEVGQVVAFLASPAASYISGVALAVDGGRTPVL